MSTDEEFLESLRDRVTPVLAGLQPDPDLLGWLRRRQARRNQLIVGATTVLVLAAGTTIVVARTALAAHHQGASVNATASNSPNTSSFSNASHSPSPSTAAVPDISNSSSMSSSRGQATAVVPDVVGMPANQAVQVLATVGFTAVQKSVPGSSGPAGVVFNQSPAANTPVTTGTAITIDISTGTSSTAGTVACSASQFVVGTAIYAPGGAPLGYAMEFDSLPLHNSGATCTFNLPGTVEVASATGPFLVATAENVGVAGAPTTYNVPHGTTVTITLGAWWRLSSQQPLPGWTTPQCNGEPIANVSRVAIPIDASNLQITLGNLWHWQEVCTTPANVSINVQP